MTIQKFSVSFSPDLERHGFLSFFMGSAIDDCLAAFCCFNCIIVQHHNTVKDNVVYEDIENGKWYEPRPRIVGYQPKGGNSE